MVLQVVSGRPTVCHATLQRDEVQLPETVNAKNSLLIPTQDYRGDYFPWVIRIKFSKPMSRGYM